MAEHLGRPLTKDEEVHHQNKNRTDDRLCNLQLMNKTVHKSIEQTGRKRSAATRALQSQRAKERNARPEYKQMLRERAKRQWATGSLTAPKHRPHTEDMKQKFQIWLQTPEGLAWRERAAQRFIKNNPMVKR